MKTNFSISILSMFCFAAICMMSCEEAYELDTSDFESSLVVNALFTSGEPWDVSVTSSHDISDSSTSIRIVEDAKVEIYNQMDDFLYELYYNENGTYSNGDYAPVAFRDYKIKVSAQGFKSVTASGSVPEKSTLTVNTVNSIDVETEEVEIDFLIEDHSQSENYYIWEVIHLDEHGGNSSANGKCTTLSKTWINNLKNNPDKLIDDGRDIINNDLFGDGKYNTTYNSKDNSRFSGNNNAGSGVVTTSELNNVSQIVKTLQNSNVNLPGSDNGTEIFTSGGNGGEDGDGDEEVIVYKYELRVMTISKELYDFYYSLEESRRYDLSVSFQKPVKIYTNVNNGLGIFAGYSESSLKF